MVVQSASGARGGGGKTRVVWFSGEGGIGREAGIDRGLTKGVDWAVGLGQRWDKVFFFGFVFGLS